MTHELYHAEPHSTNIPLTQIIFTVQLHTLCVCVCVCWAVMQSLCSFYVLASVELAQLSAFSIFLIFCCLSLYKYLSRKHTHSIRSAPTWLLQIINKTKRRWTMHRNNCAYHYLFIYLIMRTNVHRRTKREIMRVCLWLLLMFCISIRSVWFSQAWTTTLLFVSAVWRQF